MVATQTVQITRIRLIHIVMAIGLMAGALFALRVDTHSQQRPVTIADLDVANMGAWERAYFLEGAQAPRLVGSGVNESIRLNASVNATVAAGNANGNRERLMFGAQ